MNRSQIQHRIQQFLFFSDCIKSVQGAIVECGVGAGHSLEMICQFFPHRKIFAIDSFKGFPQSLPIDGRFHNKHKMGKMPTGYLTLQDTQKLLKDYQVTGKTIAGYFENILPAAYPGHPIALLNLDCDLYTSYKAALSLYQFVIPGGLVAFDEYQSESRAPGAKIAIDEFFQEQSKNIKKFKFRTYERYYLIKP